MAVDWSLLDPNMAAKIGGSVQQGRQNALAMQGAQQEQQMNALKLQQAQQEMANQNALREAYRSSGGDLEKAQKSLMAAGQPEAALKISEHLGKQDKLALETRKAKAETALKEIEYIDHALGGVRDQAGLDAARQHIAQNVGEDRAANIPQVYDPQVIEGLRQQGSSYKDQVAQAHQKTMEELKGKEIEALGGYRQQQLGLATQAEQRQQKTASAPKPLSTQQQSMLMGAANTMDAIKEYRTTLNKFTPSDLLSPDAISDVNNKYQNMIMQAKEVYKLGALTGPDKGVLENIITNPVSFKGTVTSKKALDKQANDLARLMSKAGEVATMPEERLLGKLKESTAPESTSDEALRKEYEQYLRSQE